MPLQVNQTDVTFSPQFVTYVWQYSSVIWRWWWHNC